MFRNDKSREAFETLNCKRKIWAERAMILDELDLALGLTLSLEVGCLS